MSKDTIYRQDAIDIIEDFPHGDVWNVESMEEMVYRIKQLPSAQPDAPDTNVGDIISRQAAVTEIAKFMLEYGGENEKRERDALHRAANGIKALPSAQPEQESFEWCHDCKEYDQEKHCCHRWTKTIRKTVDELKQSAQQGAWQQCHITTPTGGQHCVWECDGCGARVAERTKYCADCGRKMTGWMAD